MTYMNTIVAERVAQVKKFVYTLCLKFMRDGKHDSDIERKVLAANQVNGTMNNFMSSQKFSKQARVGCAIICIVQIMVFVLLVKIILYASAISFCFFFLRHKL